MRVFICFDDTDNEEAEYGTGKLARWFEKVLPEGCVLWGVLRQQLLVHPDIPYTSHNSSACVVVETTGPVPLDPLIELAIKHIDQYALPGSDPGLCVALEQGDLADLMEFGNLCTRQIMTQNQAMKAASKWHLSGHGGTQDGIIGAAAAVGLTASGWAGRFIEFQQLRKFEDPIRVRGLEQKGIRVIAHDRDAKRPGPDDWVHTQGWLRPRLLGHVPVLIVQEQAKGIWQSLGKKTKAPHTKEA
jgi:tRNA(Ile2) C34 agmatinyltransferase TiaS